MVESGNYPLALSVPGFDQKEVDVDPIADTKMITELFPGVRNR